VEDATEPEVYERLAEMMEDVLEVVDRYLHQGDNPVKKVRISSMRRCSSGDGGGEEIPIPTSMPLSNRAFPPLLLSLSLSRSLFMVSLLLLLLPPPSYRPLR